MSTSFSLLRLILLTDFHKNASFRPNMLNYLNTTFTFGKQTKDNFITESFNAGLHIHSLIFVPAFPLVWYGLIIHFWLKSRNNMNAARGNTVTSKISSWLYDDENIKNKKFHVSQLSNRVLTCWIEVESQRVFERPPGSSWKANCLLRTVLHKPVSLKRTLELKFG